MEKKSHNIENTLLESLRNDSRSALSVIYDLYAKNLLEYVSKATKSKLDAEEIVHDIFLSLWQNRKILSQDTKLSSYLFSIAYRRRIDYFRKMVNAPIFEDYQNFKERFSEHASASAELEYSDFLMLFNSVLDSLPKRLQSVIKLSRINGLTNQEISDKLNISKKTISNALSEGLPLLRVRLSKLLKLQ